MHIRFMNINIARLSLYGKTRIGNNMICVVQSLYYRVTTVAGNRSSLEENNSLSNRKEKKRGGVPLLPMEGLRHRQNDFSMTRITCADLNSPCAENRKDNRGSV